MRFASRGEVSDLRGFAAASGLVLARHNTGIRGRYTLTELGTELGGVTVGGLSRARSLMSERIGQAEDLACRVATIEKRLRSAKA